MVVLANIGAFPEEPSAPRRRPPSLVQLKRVDIRGLAWADITSNELKKMAHAHDGAGAESARSFLPYGPKQS